MRKHEEPGSSLGSWELLTKLYTELSCHFCGRPAMEAPAGAAGEDTAAPAPEFEVAALQEQLQRQIEQYEAEVLANWRHVDANALRQSVKDLETGPEEEEPDIDEQEVLRKDAATRRKNKRRVLFGPDVDELYGKSPLRYCTGAC